MFEVMAVFGTTHLALSMAEKATRVNAISNHAMQCHRTRVVLIFTNHGLTDRSFKTGSVLWSVIFYIFLWRTIVDSTPSHRIAQCSSVRVTILEGESIPIQVDGEAWLQEPGVIQIKHKVRVK